MDEMPAFTEITGTNTTYDITVYALSTCGFCKQALDFLRNNGFTYRYLFIDKLPLEEKEAIKKELREKYQERISFPFTVIDGKEVLVGFIRPHWELTLGMKDA